MLCTIFTILIHRKRDFGRTNEKLVEVIRAELREMGIHEKRLHFRQVVLLSFNVLTNFISDYTVVILNLGKLLE